MRPACLVSPWSVSAMRRCARRESGSRARSRTPACGSPAADGGAPRSGVAAQARLGPSISPSACALLAASGQVVADAARWGGDGRRAVSLAGEVRPVAGSIAIALAARDAGLTRLLVPAESARAPRSSLGSPCSRSPRSGKRSTCSPQSAPCARPSRRTRGRGAARGRNSPMSAVSLTPCARWWWPRPAATTCCSSGRRAPARRCWASLPGILPPLEDLATLQVARIPLSDRPGRCAGFPSLRSGHHTTRSPRSGWSGGVPPRAAS